VDRDRVCLDALYTERIVAFVNVAATLLGLVEAERGHGYDLKHRYDALFGRRHPLRFGQVYATLARLLRDGAVQVEGTEQVDGPERRIYGITATGVEQLERWLREPMRVSTVGQDELFAKVMLALRSERDAEALLDRQRTAYLQRMRELTGDRRTSRLVDAAAIDRELFHLEADLRWIDVTAARVSRLRKELMSGA
jgi:DNA-binding PadR family transcriptional regulator